MGRPAARWWCSHFGGIDGIDTSLKQVAGLAGIAPSILEATAGHGRTAAQRRAESHLTAPAAG